MRLDCTFKNRGGYSLVELIVVLGIVAVLISVSLSAYKAMGQVSTAERTAYAYVTALRDAQQRAQLMRNDSAWGVKVASTSMIVFSGASYATRTMALDTLYSYSGAATVGGPTEIVFAKLTGVPGTVGTTTFSNTYTTRTVAVWTGGAISYQP